MSAEKTSSRIRTECEEEYQQLSYAMWDQLVYLRTSLYLLRTLVDFPLERFVSPDDWVLTIVRRALFEAVVMGVARLTDKGGDTLTIYRCRHLVRDMLRPEFTAIRC